MRQTIDTGGADETVHSAIDRNGISGIREEYLNLGGLGILIGDGRLPHPGAEQILETYYSLAVFSGAFVSLDYQWVKNPAYAERRIRVDRGGACACGVLIWVAEDGLTSHGLLP